MIVFPEFARVNDAQVFSCDLETSAFDGETVSICVYVQGVQVYTVSGIVIDDSISFTFPASVNTEVVKSAIVTVSHGTTTLYGAFDVVVDPLTHSITVAVLKAVQVVIDCNISDTAAQSFIDDAFTEVIRDIKNKCQDELLYGVSDKSVVNEMVLTLATAKVIDVSNRQAESGLTPQSKERRERYAELLQNFKLIIFNQLGETGEIANVSSVRIGV